MKHFYRCDARDASQYHLVLDSTAIDFDPCVELIVTAALGEEPHPREAHGPRLSHPRAV